MLQWLKLARSSPQNANICITRALSTTPALLIKANKLPPRPKVDENEIEEVFIKGGGNGGQKINKTNSKVQLKHIPTGLVVSSQATRSREQNRKHARLAMAMKLQEMMDPENSRAAALRELRMQKKRTKVRRSRKKYGGKSEGEEDEEEEEVIVRFE